MGSALLSGPSAHSGNWTFWNEFTYENLLKVRGNRTIEPSRKAPEKYSWIYGNPWIRCLASARKLDLGPPRRRKERGSRSRVGGVSAFQVTFATNTKSGHELTFHPHRQRKEAKGKTHPLSDF
jgi:hypothetical protein